MTPPVHSGEETPQKLPGLRGEVQGRVPVTQAGRDLVADADDYWHHFPKGGVAPVTLAILKAVLDIESELAERLGSAMTSPVRSGEPQTEAGRAVAIAERALDRTSADPDDDLAILSRQLIRCREAAALAPDPRP